jgi:cobyrinic acid a,c-diamide synthase
MRVDRPRVIFSALRGNSGKTFLTVGVGACLRQRGKVVSPFKKGPDFIDPAWLEMATGQPCHNLDLFLMEKEGLIASFASRVGQSDGALVEGNRGLYDGMDREGSYSTAELAKLIKAPVVLVVDCTMATRTVAAMVLGCQHFDPEVAIRGVILNRIGGTRHESIIRSAIEDRCGAAVLGAIPKIKGGVFPERHMGLVPPREHAGAARAVEEAARIVDRYVDVDRLWEIAEKAPDLCYGEPCLRAGEPSLCSAGQPRIGFIRDSAFWFYYRDNLEALEASGASLVECSALKDGEIPDVDALYIGGGFPETHAETLAANEGFRKSLKEAVEEGLPVYAECGGLMYLGKELVVEGNAFPMAGVFPFTSVLDGTPQGHGYTILKVDTPNPYFPADEILCGHEFHYSRIPDWAGEGFSFVFDVKRGRGIQGRRDGLCYKNVLATYSHLHALGARGWAKALFERAVQHRQRKSEDKCMAIEALPVAADGSVTAGRALSQGLIVMQP